MNSYGPSVIRDGLVLHLDAANSKGFFGEPTTNYNCSYNGTNPYDPWTVRGTNTLVTEPSLLGPIKEARTWKLEKTASSPGNEVWNGWEADYSGIWTGNSGDVWTTSYWYKTSQPAGHTGFGIGAFFTTNWSRAYNTTILANVSSIIPDGNWHYNYTTTRFDENYTAAIIVDGPSWGYTTGGGEMYINALQWEKKAYPTPFVAGVRGTTVATGGGLYDISGNGNHGELVNGPIYSTSGGGSLLLNGNGDYVIASPTIGQSGTFSIWIKSSNYNGKIPFSIDGNSYSSGPNMYFTGTILAWNTGDGGANPFSNSYYPDSNWHNICITNEYGVNAKLYIDGTFIGTATSLDCTATGANKLWLGRFHGDNNYTIAGNITLAAIYNRTLSASEILNNYNATKGRFGL